MADNENENFTNNNTVNEDSSTNNADSKQDVKNVDVKDVKDTKVGEEASQEDKQDKKAAIIHEIISWATTIIGAIVLAFIITTFIIVSATPISLIFYKVLRAKYMFFLYLFMRTIMFFFIYLLILPHTVHIILGLIMIFEFLNYNVLWINKLYDLNNCIII